MTTNCILFKDRAASLAGLIDLLHFSLDADTPALHDEIRGRKLAHLLETVPLALANGLFPRPAFHLHR